MATQTEIAKRALAFVGGTHTITSLADGTTEAGVLSLHYDGLKDELLEATNWNFARSAAVLVKSKAAYGLTGSAATSATWEPVGWPPPGWGYSYLFPTDFITARYVWPTVQPLPTAALDPMYARDPPYRFAMAHDTIAATMRRILVTDLDGVVLIYTKRVDENVWPAMFTQAFAMILASRIAPSLAVDLEVLKVNAQQGYSLLDMARVHDANQGYTPVETTPESMKVRGFVEPEYFLP